MMVRIYIWYSYSSYSYNHSFGRIALLQRTVVCRDLPDITYYSYSYSYGRIALLQRSASR